MTTRKKQLAIRVGQDELKTVEAAAAQWPNQTKGQIGVPLARSQMSGGACVRESSAKRF